MTRTVVALLAALTLVGLRAAAPNVYAIRGVRIVTAAGPPIEGGVIVIRGGLIEAVGRSVTPPAGARVVDANGLVAYPGLIDLGNTRVADQPAPQQPQNLATAEVERWKRTQLLKPQARAADAVKVDDAEMTKLAAAGITTVLARPAGDVVAGQSALVNVVGPPDEPQIGTLVESRRGLVVVRTPVALHVSFPERPRVAGTAYPRSLMGVIAFVRQAFLDAQHYALERAHAERVKSGGPPDDPALAAMQPAIARQQPVAFEANLAREIRRALKLARELKLTPIITGAREADAVAAELVADHVSIVYSLNYPKRPRTLAPDADEPIRVLRARVDASKIPARLAAARVTFAFESAGLDDPKEFVKNASRAVTDGLAADAAVRALTIDAATIGGVADRLGTIAAGKIANVILTSGDLFDERTKVVRVFVEGRDVALDAPVPAGARRPAGAR